MPHDLRPFVAQLLRRVDAHTIADSPGAYARWLWQDAKNNRKLGPSAYGCADAIHVLYTLNAIPSDRDWQTAAIARLQSFQSPDDGLFREEPMHPLHTTAFLAGALELLNARPLHVAAGLQPYATEHGLRELMESIDWTRAPWPGSHRGAGIYASMLLAGSPPGDWEDHYFAWLEENQDPATGLWRRGCIRDAQGRQLGAPLFHHVASSFHYLFNLDHARRPLPRVERFVDTCLAMAGTADLPVMGRGFSWNEIDWLYTLRSLQKRTCHRSAELTAEIRRVADALASSVLRLDPETDDSINDLHTLFAGVSALAVAQEAIPGLLRTERPLRLVLDRKPFL